MQTAELTILIALCRLLLGTTLTEYLHSISMPEETVLDLTAQLFDVGPARLSQFALRSLRSGTMTRMLMQTQQCMHDVAGLAHLDISSNNIMVCKVGSGLELRVFDLGCCRWFPPGVVALECL